MSGWRLVPGTIASVLAQVEADLDAMNLQWSVRRLDRVGEDLAEVGPAGADVLAAVVEVLNAQGERLATMGNRVSAGVVGVDAACAAFEAGQTEMVGQCQSQMLASAGSGEFGWWSGSELPAGVV